ncbi:GH1 family beta-glucosidase [Janibacter limosus]|uniref:GH1 family beta-glucosidase n=1 Tax=Janibacter limosus TaxID=53458 RepID=UPI000831471E|nr:GH1 family beta-glucosidase [Janibacter limosus]
MPLPHDFVFGTSTASYQIEGGVTAGGRGRSIWDDFCDRPGAIRDGSSGAVACDSYHRWDEDVDLLSGLGVDAYRFSIAWPRIQPTGSGSVNPAGLDFYDRGVDALCEAGIAPFVTLYHWDLPSALQAKGGWMTRETAERFGEYAAIVGERLADRVAMWLPVNEPVVVTLFGHALGLHAPGEARGFEALAAAHHLLLGHGLATRALRAAGVRVVGTANNHTPVHAASDADEDVAAAALYDTIHNRAFAEPILLGEYPNGMGEGMLGPVAEDLAIISEPLDAYGVNYYNPTTVGAPGSAAVVAASTTSPGEEPPIEIPEGIPFALVPVEAAERTAFGWPVVPEGLTELLVQLRERYGDRLPPIYITESGCSTHDVVEDGAVHDDARIRYLDAHLDAVADAIDAGVDVRGHFVWSLLDNFEWAEGYTQRFGLVRVGIGEGEERTPKDSYAWLRGRISQVRASS